MIDPKMIDPELARGVVRQALECGAGDAECTIVEGQEFSAQVRMRALEKLKDAGSRRAGLRVLIGKRVGSAHTSDLSNDGLLRMVDSALSLPKTPTRTYRKPPSSAPSQATSSFTPTTSAASTPPRASRPRLKPKR